MPGIQCVETMHSRQCIADNAKIHNIQFIEYNAYNAFHRLQCKDCTA